jgi:hypothetical protein
MSKNETLTSPPHFRPFAIQSIGGHSRYSVANQMDNNPRATASLTILLMFRVLKVVYGLLCQRARARRWGKLTQTTEEKPVSCILVGKFEDYSEHG